jgi:hypothetical protein
MAERDLPLPLYPGDKLAILTPSGWIALHRDRMADMPRALASGQMSCGQWPPPEWGWPPLICTDHRDGYHAAAVKTTWYGPRIIAVWVDDDLAVFRG